MILELFIILFSGKLHLYAVRVVLKEYNFFYLYKLLTLKLLSCDVQCSCIVLVHILLLSYFLFKDNVPPNTWKSNKGRCKIAASYPIGNLSLSNASLSCEQSAYKGPGPCWIGVVKQLYRKEDLGDLYK